MGGILGSLGDVWNGMMGYGGTRGLRHHESCVVETLGDLRRCLAERFLKIELLPAGLSLVCHP